MGSDYRTQTYLLDNNLELGSKNGTFQLTKKLELELKTKTELTKYSKYLVLPSIYQMVVWKRKGFLYF